MSNAQLLGFRWGSQTSCENLSLSVSLASPLGPKGSHLKAGLCGVQVSLVDQVCERHWLLRATAPLAATSTVTAIVTMKRHLLLQATVTSNPNPTAASPPIVNPTRRVGSVRAGAFGSVPPVLPTALYLLLESSAFSETALVWRQALALVRRQLVWRQWLPLLSDVFPFSLSRRHGLSLMLFCSLRNDFFAFATIASGTMACGPTCAPRTIASVNGPKHNNNSLHRDAAGCH